MGPGRDHRGQIQQGNTHVPVPFPQTEDLDVLSSLVDELSQVLESNRSAVDHMCAVADQLSVDNEEMLSQHDGVETPRAPDQPSDRCEAYRLENESLRRQIEVQKIKNLANARLLRVCQLGLESCLKQLRPFAHQRTMQTLAIHKEYIGKIEDEQNKFMDLVHTRAQLEQNIYQLARHLGQILHTATEYSDPKTTVDYIDSLKLTLQSYTNPNV
ncbi:hypothetical protein TRICI_006250 [Trichomonascus ciferrii]|uniref:Uncharacterized protein n=1 Tax=Trichomonascus ciferrii TaxID=44093 RepID=A0A642UQX3_9ASCO|nr:hypothetical protein TRICI_006250 [Trichomonascus ciferrii]